MFSSPIKNCCGFFQNRPPFVIFLLCLILLAIATLSFAFYVKQTDHLINTDAKKNWLRLAEYMKSMELCENSESFEPNIQDDVSFTTIITVDLEKLWNYSRIHATYQLKDWHPNCPEDFELTSSVYVDFEIPRVNDVIKSREYKICALVKGPKEYLPKYSRSACNYTISDNFNDKSSSPAAFVLSNAAGNMAAAKIGGQSTPITTSTILTNLYSVSRNNYSLCQTNGLKTKLLFDGDNNGENFAIFLSQTDKSIIYNHLIWCTCILVTLIILLLCYAMLQKWDEQYDF